MEIGNNDATEAANWCVKNIGPMRYFLHNAMGSDKWHIKQPTRTTWQIEFTGKDSEQTETFFALQYRSSR